MITVVAENVDLPIQGVQLKRATIYCDLENY